MLVVLAIIGIVSGVTVLSMGSSGSGTRVEAEAKRLASRLELAADEAMITDRAIGFAQEQGSYHFVTWDAQRKQWGPEVLAELGESHALPANVTLTSDVATSPLPIGADRGGAARFTLAAGENIWTVRFDGVGTDVARDK